LRTSAVATAAATRWIRGCGDEVDVAIGSETVQITVEDLQDLAPSDERRFAIMAVPREKFAAALGDRSERTAWAKDAPA
jgi:hypothetical protein